MPEYIGRERRQIETDAYQGPERRRQPGDVAFERAVETAAANAAQRVARIHRVRLVTQAGLASFTAAALIMFGIGQLYRDEARQDSVSFSRSNCRLVKTLARVTDDFIETDASLRTVQAKSAISARLIKDFAKTIPQRDLAASVNESNFDNTWTVNRWRRIDERELNGLVATNCSVRVR
jgi:hypothetical protein